jgi:hypothetical protein
MTIPHVAIVAGLLLGANNPNTLEGIVGKKYSEGKPYIGIFELSYPSSYKTEWMWYVSGEHLSSYLGMSQEELLLVPLNALSPLFSLGTSALETCLGSNNSKPSQKR